VELSDDEKEALTTVSAMIDTSADRYPEKMQKWIDR
jgi:hypothetical protein